MRRQTQIRLYYALPAVFWLLAVVGTLVPVILQITNHKLQITNNYYWGYLVTAIVLTCIVILGRIKRHENAVEQCFQIAVLLGVASYWLPTVVFLTIPIHIYLINKHLFDLRSVVATLLGYVLVAIWAVLAVFIGWIANPWAAFFAKENALGWIPLGAILLAWMASTIARQNLHVR